jgi:hypothetical protein
MRYFKMFAAMKLFLDFVLLDYDPDHGSSQFHRDVGMHLITLHCLVFYYLKQPLILSTDPKQPL